MESHRTTFRIELICTLISMVITPEAGSMNVYLPTVQKEMYKNSFLYLGGKLWNDLPDFVKNSTNIDTFKRNYRIYKSLT